MSPRFSVLLPTHNRRDVVGFAISSVLRQTDPDFELLVVGDGCTDDTASVVQASADPRVRWFDLPKAPNFGYANRNVAVRQARGDLLAFVGHDDLILPDHLELLGRSFAERGVDWAYSRPVWVADDGVIVPSAVDLRQPDQLNDFLTKANSIPATCIVYRRSCLDRFGYWPEDGVSGGDWKYWKSIIRGAQGSNLGYVPAATTLHFRADWRRGRTWGPPALQPWLRSAAERGSWPAALNVAVSDGQSAQAALWRVIDADPEGWPRTLRAGIAEAMDQIAWTTAVAMPGVTRTLRAVVLRLSQAGFHEDALAVAEQALQIAPGNAGLHHARGIALMGGGRPADAESDFGRAIALEPGTGAHHAQLGRALSQQGRVEEAIAEARRATDVEPDAAHLHNLLGQLLARDGRLAEARAALAEAHRLDPRLQAAADRLADVNRRLG